MYMRVSHMCKPCDAGPPGATVYTSSPRAYDTCPKPSKQYVRQPAYAVRVGNVHKCIHAPHLYLLGEPPQQLHMPRGQLVKASEGLLRGTLLLDGGLEVVVQVLHGTPREGCTPAGLDKGQFALAGVYGLGAVQSIRQACTIAWLAPFG